MSDDELFQFASDFKTDTRRTCDVAHVYIYIHIHYIFVYVPRVQGSCGRM